LPVVGDSLVKEVCMKRLFLLGLVLVMAVPLGASTFLKMTQKDLVRDSAAVIQGHVVKVSSFWDPTGRMVQSEALVRVESKVFGEAPSVVVVRTFGGTVGDFRVDAEGFPKFQLNDHLLLFLEPEQDGATRVAGYQQGQFRIVQDKSGALLAVPAFDGASLLTKDGRVSAPAQTIRLDDLKASIRSEARRAGRVVYEN
jgi:hypothetical protein